MKPRSWVSAVAVLCFAAFVPAQAATILSPVAVVGNTLGTAGGSTSHLIDQSGLSANFISGETDFDTYINLGPTSAAVSSTTGWASSANTLPGYLEFDLGGDYTISGFALWTQNNILAVNSFTLISASDAAFTSGVTNLGTFTATIGLSAQTFTVSGVGEFVRLEINSSHGAVSVNLGEVAFDAEVIPEPGSLAVLGLGIVGIGFAGRRRA